MHALTPRRLLAGPVIAMMLTPAILRADGDSATTGPPSSIIEFLPILSYDTDVGLGLGAKAVFRGQLGSEESFDVVLFNSTKGERWYRFVFSLPDIELRQGKHYPIAIDLVVDYDKWISNSFFGVGPGSKYSDKSQYTKEPLDISITASRGFSAEAVGQFGLRFRSVRNFDIPANSLLSTTPPALNSGRIGYASFFGTFRYDTRNSFINPSDGLVVQAEAEGVPAISMNTISGARFALWIQHYAPMIFPRIVAALRLGLQGVSGNSLPVQFLESLGGNGTLRGFSEDRFLDRVAVVFNAELRIPIIWRFEGILGADAGEVAGSLRTLNTRWKGNPVVGLRLLMETFVVRADVGFGNETTGFYLNFGQLF